MASRSTAVVFTNTTRNTGLYKVDEDLPHGVWTTEPPEFIGPGAQVVWGSESDGFLTGTEGKVRYLPGPADTDNIGIPVPLADSDAVIVHWDNPYVGSNSYNASAPAPYQVNQESGTGSGDNATVRFDLGGLYGPDTCAMGYVWRGASPNDHVCVTPATRDQVANDNSQAASRIDPHGAFGPNTCVVGYVWREAFAGDTVCVTPAIRTQTAEDNSNAPNRVI